MPEFPVQVTRADNGEYVASLVDVDGGPVGRGVDPYAAYKDLLDPALEMLNELSANDSLPDPSEPDDRPVIEFGERLDESENGETMQSQFGRVKQSRMICYNWTNNVMFFGS